MVVLSCPVCEAKVELPQKAKLDDRVSCLNCYAQLVFRKIKGKLELRCSLCPGDEIECTEDCERRLAHLKQMELLE